MKSMLAIACFALVTASQCAHARSDDVLRSVNRLRAPGGACASSAPALVSQGALDAIAAQLARGASLDAALASSDYRATKLQAINLTWSGMRPQFEALLAARYCSQIGSASLSEAGVHEGKNQLWLVLAAPFAPKVEMTRQQTADRVIALVNAARSKSRRCGDESFAVAPSVSWNEPLAHAASLYAIDMARNNYFSHTGRDGSSFAQRVTRAGYRYRLAGENIAAGQPSADEAVAGWLKSPAHCANLMNGVYTEMGVAFAVDTTSKMGVYWVQLFGAPR